MVSARKLRRDPGQDSRPELEPTPEVVRPIPGKKDTRRWCKGVVGREHVPETVLDHHEHGWHGDRECRWFAFSSEGRLWICRHVVQCSVCGKHLKTSLHKEDCPVWQETKPLP